MSELRESALYLYEAEEAAKKAAADKMEAQRRLDEEAIEKYEHLRFDRRKIQEGFMDYKRFVKDVLLQYTIEGLMDTVIDQKALEENDQNLLHGLVENYIKQGGGADAILRRCANKTILLDTIKEEVEVAAEEIIAKADPKDPDTFIVDKDDVAKMMKKLTTNDDYNEVKSAIAVRVVGAEDSFITNNQAEKEKLKEIILKAEDKCKEVDADPDMNADTKEAIKQEAMQIAQRETVRIKESPRKAIFDEMVRLFSNSAMKNQRKKFLTESGNINAERVITSVKTMYALIETLNSTKLEKVDEAFIDEVMKEVAM